MTSKSLPLATTPILGQTPREFKQEFFSNAVTAYLVNFLFISILSPAYLRLTELSRFKHCTVVICLFSVFACTAVGKVRQEDSAPNESITSGQGRIIAIGDVHGDYDQFVKLLRMVGLINRRNKWAGRDAHLVQMGDIPDRGPDSRKTMDLLIGLEKSARKTGGRVTVLIGNHEAMMMTNDLRYVHPGEFKAFADRHSEARRNDYYKRTIEHLTKISPAEELPEFDAAHRKNWEQQVPLGYVEHRIAWAPTGKYGKWVLSHPAVVKIGESVFVHGGLSTAYAGMSIAEINTRVRTDLANTVINETSILEDELGPLWYRGWANLAQTVENEVILDEVLAAFGATRMVVAHTPLLPIILPRFGGKVLMVDVGLSAHYGHGFSALEIINGQVTAIIGEQSLALPVNSLEIDTYLQAATALIADDGKIARYQAKTKQAVAEELINAERNSQLQPAAQ